MKILTANIAMGNKRAAELLGNIRSLLWFHNWRVIPFLVSGGRFGNLFEYGSHSRKGRIEWIRKHSSIDNVVRLIAEELPDVVALNELIRQAHYEPLNAALAELGYGTVIWGHSPHHPDATISTVVASRLPTLQGSAMKLTWGMQMGGGGGAAYVRMANMPLTIVGCHLAIGKGMQPVFEKEIAELREFAEAERAEGREVIIAGDFNATDSVIRSTAGFASLRLRTVTDQKTCPVCLPEFMRTACDHIFLPESWMAEGVRFPAFGSDHLAVVAEAIRSQP